LKTAGIFKDLQHFLHFCISDSWFPSAEAAGIREGLVFIYSLHAKIYKALIWSERCKKACQSDHDESHSPVEELTDASEQKQAALRARTAPSENFHG